MNSDYLCLHSLSAPLALGFYLGPRPSPHLSLFPCSLQIPPHLQPRLRHTFHDFTELEEAELSSHYLPGLLVCGLCQLDVLRLWESAPLPWMACCFCGRYRCQCLRNATVWVSISAGYEPASIPFPPQPIEQSINALCSDFLPPPATGSRVDAPGSCASGLSVVCLHCGRLLDWIQNVLLRVLFELFTA